MNRYEITMLKGDTRYTGTVYGDTLDQGIDHADYFAKAGDKLKTDYTGIQIVNTVPINYDPYVYENAVRKALAHPFHSIHAILQQDYISESDKLDLIKRIANGVSFGFCHMDTAERDYLIDIMEEVN